MRLAMRISPSRVSSSTVPISRMYMRTGSVVRPSSASSAASAAAASSMASSSAGCEGSVGEQRLGIRCLLVHRNAHVVDRVDDVFDLLRIDDLGGQVIVHLRIGEVALLLAARDQQLQLRLAVFGHRRHAALDAQRALVGGELAPLPRRAWRFRLAVRAAAGRAAGAPFFAGAADLGRAGSRRRPPSSRSEPALTGFAGCAAGRFLWRRSWACAYVSCTRRCAGGSPYVLPSGGRLKGREGKARNSIGRRSESPNLSYLAARVAGTQFNDKYLKFLKFILR